MRVRDRLKRVLGRALTVDLMEKLTEYSLLEQEPAVSLKASELIAMRGTSWAAVADGGRRELWKLTLARIPTEQILLLEFGVFKGDSLREFVRLNRSRKSLFYGFDSFEGLPEVWRGTSKERFSTGGELPDISDPRVHFVKGWFRDTLPPLLNELQDLASERALVVHFDADLYSSTLYLLFELARAFDSYDFIFDEFGGHEVRALYNFLQATGAECEFFHHVEWGGLPTAVSGHLRMPGQAKQP